MIVYSLLFTLVGKDPAENRYIEMFYMWLAYVVRNAGLAKGDKVRVLIDEASLDIIDYDFINNILSNSNNIGIELKLIQQPSTLSQGIAERYNPANIGDFTEATIFLDLDVLVLKPLTFIKDLGPDTLSVSGEGKIYEHSYGGLVLERVAENESLPGITGAIYAFSYGKRVAELFNNVRTACLQQHPPFYTIDQPFFNKYVYESIFRGDKFIDMMNGDFSENNKLYPLHSTVFMNFCGEPGEGTKHHQKMLAMLCLDILTGSRRYDGDTSD